MKLEDTMLSDLNQSQIRQILYYEISSRGVKLKERENTIVAEAGSRETEEWRVALMCIGFSLL